MVSARVQLGRIYDLFFYLMLYKLTLLIQNSEKPMLSGSVLHDYMRFYSQEEEEEGEERTWTFSYVNDDSR